MSSFLDLIGSPPPRPRRVLLYGTHGIGKSTFAANAPKPVFICTEDGLRDIPGVKAFPLCQDIGEVFQQIEELRTLPHEFETLAIDSIDWAEKFIWHRVCENGGKESIADFGFGKGYDSAADMFRNLLDELSKLTNERGMMVILLAHCKVERFANPATEGYDRYSPKVHKHINGTLQEWCDEVLFANYKVFVRSEDLGFEKARGLGIGSGERVIYTTEMPSHLAKNRLTECPEQLPLSFKCYWDVVQKHYAGVSNL